MTAPDGPYRTLPPKRCLSTHGGAGLPYGRPLGHDQWECAICGEHFEWRERLPEPLAPDNTTWFVLAALVVFLLLVPLIVTVTR